MTTFQDPNPFARALPGDRLYDVSVLIPDLGGSTPEEAAKIFWRVLRKDDLELYFDVEDTATHEKTTVLVNSRSVDE